MASKYGSSKTIRCMHCGAENPSTAYCCLSCFKVIKNTVSVPFWKVHIKPTMPAIVVIFTVFFALVFLLKHWMENIDAQITMNFKSVDYSLSFMADKRKKQEVSTPEPNRVATSTEPAAGRSETEEIAQDLYK